MEQAKLEVFTEACRKFRECAHSLDHSGVKERLQEMEERGYPIDTDVYVLGGIIDSIEDDLNTIRVYRNRLYCTFDLGSDENNTELKQIKAWARRMN